MEWIKYSNESKPKDYKDYLCIIVVPVWRYGGYQTRIMSLSWGRLGWECDDMIVAYWTEMPEIPKEIVL